MFTFCTSKSMRDVKGEVLETSLAQLDPKLVRFLHSWHRRLQFRKCELGQWLALQALVLKAISDATVDVAVSLTTRLLRHA